MENRVQNHRTITTKMAIPTCLFNKAGNPPKRAKRAKGGQTSNDIVSPYDPYDITDHQVPFSSYQYDQNGRKSDGISVQSGQPHRIVTKFLRQNWLLFTTSVWKSAENHTMAIRQGCMMSIRPATCTYKQSQQHRRFASNYILALRVFKTGKRDVTFPLVFMHLEFKWLRIRNVNH